MCAHTQAAANALEGFGIVTLASLMPVLAVELLSIGLKIQYTHEDIIAMRPPPGTCNTEYLTLMQYGVSNYQNLVP